VDSAVSPECFQRNVIRPDDSTPGNGNRLGCFCRPRHDVRKTERFLTTDLVGKSCAAWDCPNLDGKCSKNGRPVAICARVVALQPFLLNEDSDLILKADARFLFTDRPDQGRILEG
jgi:hypothetical protein